MNSALVRNLLTLYIVGDLNIAHHTARRPLLGFASAVVTVCHLLKAAASTKRPIRLAPQRSYSCLHRQLKWKKKKVTLFFFFFLFCMFLSPIKCAESHTGWQGLQHITLGLHLFYIHVKWRESATYLPVLSCEFDYTTKNKALSLVGPLLKRQRAMIQGPLEASCCRCFITEASSWVFLGDKDQ